MSSLNSDLYGRASWQGALVKVKKKIDFWSLRTLSLEGKVLIVKAVVIPILLFLYYVFPAPDRVMKQIVRVCFSFFGCLRWRS